MAGRWLRLIPCRCQNVNSINKDKKLGFDQLQRAVEHAKHAAKFLATLEDTPAGGDDGKCTLPARQLRILDDLEQRHFAGAAENGKDGAVGEVIDRIVTPFIGGDHAAVEPEDLIQ